MIEYSPGSWSIAFALSLRGSVLPKAFALALPNAVLAFLLHVYARPPPGVASIFEGCEIFWSGYTFVLGFLLVFRNNQAYSRFWEGATRIQQIRGEWLNAFSNLVAFSSTKAPAHEVERFHQMMARLFSLMHCSALQQVADLEDDTMDIIECSGFAYEFLEYLQDANDRCEIILQWVQRAIVEASHAGIIDVPPPILSRVFQELSHGIVNLNNVRQLKEIPFPFPYSQTLTYLLVIHWVTTAVLASQFMGSAVCAAFLSFVLISAYWTPLYIALEIDQPFGGDANDLPVKMLQSDMNQSLLQLLEPMAQTVPSYRITTHNMDPSTNCARSEGVLSADRNKGKRTILQRNVGSSQESDTVSRSLGSFIGLGSVSITSFVQKSSRECSEFRNSECRNSECSDSEASTRDLEVQARTDRNSRASSRTSKQGAAASDLRISRLSEHLRHGRESTRGATSQNPSPDAAVSDDVQPHRLPPPTASDCDHDFAAVLRHNSAQPTEDVSPALSGTRLEGLPPAECDAQRLVAM
eukprot:TRINITY_DN71_c3_g1_i1.p1 TRINITY_DN71_c3_g1~~TRINITY_DN71_c3_g1_i1.p1  ORF type:complete len:525 (+),score=37.80 TRINITY_DN71_c3_g1_i1:58-1632(+)